jgi:Ca2+-binding RTX toxin-like protein
VSVSVSGSTLTVTGSSAADAPQFGYYEAAAGQPGYTRVFDPGGVTILAGACDQVDPDSIPQQPQNIARCQDGGTAALLTQLVLTLGDGADAPYLQECFDTVTINAGEGSNTARVPSCTSGAYNFTAGAGQDSLAADTGSLMAISADLGAGDDNFTGGGGPGAVHGGAGNDYLVGTDGSEQLFGDDGNDTFLGHGGNDSYDGGAGDDTFGLTKGVSNDDDPGNDDYRGGPGSDLLVLDNHPAGVTISLDEVANDGSSGEADNVHNDIELIRATTHNDVLTGGPGNDRFEGYSGDDTIRGAGGDDDLDGGGGDDKVYGDAGNDKVQGLNGADTVDGGTGADQLYGDIAGCSVFCSFDSDVVLARDGERDTVDCGGGADTAQVDSLDVVAFCTTIDRQTVAGASATFSFAKGKILSVRKGVGATVTCPAACSFTVSVVLSAKTARKYKLGRKALTVGSVRGALLAAGSKKVTVKLSKKAKRRLKRAKKVAVTLKVKATDAAGKSTTKTKAVSLSR